ncbi:unnamed protein product [Parascedosporium putredinis]|uniref:Major facilitator superfamily (MFS) profile domain-containing protein n=1 Tax=Parascedosporium putredinis TaxID=1442378 RepID=A0A9P1GZH1_9PEZI|nr:unnamed protein product [Parascedosporium putredinis]CAI7991099.1 unnamed protein product [Parascedosporium putredinis]
MDHDSEKSGAGAQHEGKKIIRRVDRRLVTMVGVLYCVSLMDRTNLSAASIAGMMVELELIGNRYVLPRYPSLLRHLHHFPAPSTVIIRKLGPRIHLSVIVLLWGAVMIGFGFVKKWYELAALRLVLGVFEAGFFPSCVYLLSTWYTRYEVGKRYSVFYIIGCVASAFAGILAYGLMQMNGLADLTGWRWIFIIEGILTCVIAFIGAWLLVDFPDSDRVSWNFLDAREKAYIIARVQADRGDATVTAFSMSKFLRAGLDPKIWGYALIFFCTTTMSYAIAYFLPIILNLGMGFDVGASQLRGPIIVFNMVLCFVGLCIVGWHKNNGVRYFGVFFMTAGANSNIPAAMAYQANNIRGQWKRAFCSATLVGFGGIGGIAGCPQYMPGLYACMACCGLTIILVGILDTLFYFKNKAADRGEISIEADEDDSQSDFRYTL